MATIGEQIIEAAFAVLQESPEGVRYSELIRAIQHRDGTFKQNTVHGNVWNLHEQFPDRAYRPSRGLFRLTSLSFDRVRATNNRIYSTPTAT